MILKELTILFQRDLEKLAEEIGSYTDEADLWKTTPGINNSAGNLALHLMGNLNHFIGTVLGNTGYRRDRKREFNDKHIPRQVILKDISDTSEMIHEVFNHLRDGELNRTYPLEVFGYPMTMVHFLMHLQGHLNYHLGQINYHRRILFPD